MRGLVSDLIRSGYLATGIIINAFLKIDRAEFVLPEDKKYAHDNIPLFIGHGQTISQPLTVAIMLEFLDPKKGHLILDVGSGSGWTTALLAYIVGEKGKIIAIERIKELVEFGKKNVDKFGYIQKGIAQFYRGDGSKGFQDGAPYDRILVSAMADCVPNELKNQLKIGGKMIIPVSGDLWQLEKRGKNDFYKKEYLGFNFVPLVGA
jgi:protein-L-isoaspartate(D-aspartate) O-methyltransferase